MGVPNHEIEESGRNKVLLGYGVQQVLDGKLVLCLSWCVVTHTQPQGEVALGENPLQLASKQCPKLGTRLRKSDPQFAREKKLGIGNSSHTLLSLS